VKSIKKLKGRKNSSSVNPAMSISSTAMQVFMEEQGEGIATLLHNHRKTYTGLRLVDVIQISCLCKGLAWNLDQVVVELV